MIIPQSFAPLDVDDEAHRRSELEDALDESIRNNRGLSFPEDIQNMDYWMCFRINKFQLTRKDDFPIKTDLKRIFLPVPLNFATQYGHTYNTEGIGLAGIAGADFGKGVANNLGAGKDLLTSIKNEMEAFKDNITRVEAALPDAAVYYGLQAAEGVGSGLGTVIAGIVLGGKAAAATMLAGAAGGQFVKGAIAGAGVALNPYMAVMYNSPQFRTHVFSWKLIAKSKKESDAIKNIIHAFKYHAAPGTEGFNPHFFIYPEQFDIDLHYSNYLFNIAPSVLTSIDVAYHGEGYPAYHDIGDGLDKAPVSIILQCTFQETSIVTKETILSENR